MVIFNAGDSYSVTFKPNSALSANGKMKVVLLLSLIPCFVGIGFSLLGAWLVLPFVGLEVFALAYAFYYVNTHENDYESITIEGDSLLIERCYQDYITQHILNPYWVKLVQHERPNGELHLGLFSHGKEIEVGRYLTRKQREALAKQLQTRVGMHSRN